MKNIIQEIKNPLIIWGIIVMMIPLIYVLTTLYIPDYVQFGIYPRTFSGFSGIMLSPLLHGSWEHVFSNIIPLFVFGMTGSVYYKKIFYQSAGVIYLLSGFWVWIGGRGSFHIGASGVVYGMAFFLFVLGLIHYKRDRIALQIAMFVALFYGGMVWGMLPGLQEISWESHWFGALSGVIMAIYFRNNTPEPPRYEWELKEDSDESGIWDYKRIIPPPEGLKYPEDKSKL